MRKIPANSHLRYDQYGKASVHFISSAREESPMFSQMENYPESNAKGDDLRRNETGADRGA